MTICGGYVSRVAQSILYPIIVTRCGGRFRSRVEFWDLYFMKPGAPQSYKMSFSTGGLFLNESLEVARLHREDEDWRDTITRALGEGAASLPKAASRRRTLREIANRISTLTRDELDFFTTDADRLEQQALLWLSTCRAYRFVREFAIEVIRERYLSYQLDLPLEAFDTLLDAKAEWDEGLAAINLSTRLKLRQILFRIMREAGVISEEGKIQTYYLSTRLHHLIAENRPADLAIYPGVSVSGGGK
jgi:hypothetical protein